MSKFHRNERHCWLWQGRCNHGGYPVRHGKGVHRRVYRFLVGPIADGLQVHHTCENTTCCNPAHIQLVTQGEHNRIHAGLKLAARGNRCANGHLLTEANRLARGDRPGLFRCRTCLREQQARSKRAHRRRLAETPASPETAQQ